MKILRLMHTLLWAEQTGYRSSLIWRFAFKRLMRPFVVAELDIYFQVLPCIIYAVVGGEVTSLYLTLHQRRSTVIAVYHLFVLSNPALVSAFSKISFSSVNCPILACITLISNPGRLRLHRAAESCNSCFHSEI